MSPAKGKKKKVPRHPFVKCRGGKRAAKKFDYPKDVKDCKEAIERYGVNLLCEIGCLGLGSCVQACPQGAIRIGEKGLPVIDEENCIGCGKCVRACPQGVLELYSPVTPILRFNRQDDCLAPCQQRCPAQIDIPRFIQKIKEKDYQSALMIIKDRLPMPLTLGRVCPRPCEDGCRRHQIDEPVAIDFLKRFVADYFYHKNEHLKPFLLPETGYKIAIVGGGPSGLACAYFLRRLGHKSTIYEAMPELGGMLRYGIPDYRLPPKVLDWEIEEIISLGIEVKTGVSLGRDFTLQSLKEEYEAIFLAIGAWKAREMNIEGKDLEGVMAGLDFLKRVAAGERPKIGPRVIVVGGGNVAMDAARTAIRLPSVEEVIVVYRRDQNAMPASKHEFLAAQQEGIKFMFLTNPTRFLGDKQLTAVECVKMQLGEPDASGRRRPKPILGSEFVLEANHVITAIGQSPDSSIFEEDPIGKDLEISRRGTIVVNPDTMQSNIPFIFAAGDVVLGPKRVVDAIGTARLAARSIHLFLKGKEVTPYPQALKTPLPDKVKVDPSKVPSLKRQPMPTRPVSERSHDFEEVELGFDEEMAQKEAARCLNCGIYCYGD